MHTDEELKSSHVRAGSGSSSHSLQAAVSHIFQLRPQLTFYQTMLPNTHINTPPVKMDPDKSSVYSDDPLPAQSPLASLRIKKTRGAAMTTKDAVAIERSQTSSKIAQKLKPLNILPGIQSNRLSAITSLSTETELSRPPTRRGPSSNPPPCQGRGPASNFSENSSHNFSIERWLSQPDLNRSRESDSDPDFTIKHLNGTVQTQLELIKFLHERVDRLNRTLSRRNREMGELNTLAGGLNAVVQECFRREWEVLCAIEGVGAGTTLPAITSTVAAGADAASEEDKKYKKNNWFKKLYHKLTRKPAKGEMKKTSSSELLMDVGGPLNEVQIDTSALLSVEKDPKEVLEEVHSMIRENIQVFREQISEMSKVLVNKRKGGEPEK